MKKLILALLLIVLISAKEIQEYDSISKNKKIRNDDEQILKQAITTHKFILSIDIGVTLQTFINYVKKEISYNISPANFKEIWNENGKGRFISNMNKEYVIAAYYHKTKRHTATCDGGWLGGGSIKAEAPAGKWAVAVCRGGVGGRKTYYDI